ncbi:hypothetical protein BDV93DRAFT_450913, partial [Ceratobasidium sp. AG-I]
NVTTKAAAAAITMNHHNLALEWLEEGRSIVWKQMLQLRTPIDDLFAIAPTLATELKQVAQDLDHTSSPKSTTGAVPQDTLSLEQAPQQHRRLAEKWEDLLGQAHHLSGFETFLHPQKVSQLLPAAQSGPVVLINIHSSRCDALVIQPGSTEIAHIPLQFTLQSAVRLATRRFWAGGLTQADTLEKMLALLWNEVVKPVLHHLGYMTPCAKGHLPHITWCTTRPLVFLPLHAAGDYDSNSIIFDYIVSSYTPNLSVLLQPPSAHTKFSGILAISQSSIPGMPPLPGTVAELNRIQAESQGYAFTWLNENLAIPTVVLAGIEEHSWVHLACHAKQNTKNPMLSVFYLHGGTLDLATISHKQLKNTGMVFLSACQTAAGDETLPEEAVHLAAGMLLAGYHGVIATVWAIGDNDAPLIAQKVYEHLLQGRNPNARCAAVAVHNATACLREKVGVKAFAKWVPYIHIGL